MTEIAEHVTFRAADVDGARVVYALQPWPTLIQIASEFLDGSISTDHIKPGDIAGDFTITVKNGAAHYRKVSEADGFANLELMPGSTFEAPPDVMAPAPPIEVEVSETAPLVLDEAPAAAPAAQDYFGPELHETVLHDGARKEVLATRATAAGSEVSFNAVDYYPVSQCEPIKAE
jgi:hypothetical protein